MSIVLVGGMDRLGEQYRVEAERHGRELHIFSRDDGSVSSRIKKAEAVVIFTNKVSHQARHRAVNAAKKEGVPVFMHHSCGVCSLRECLNCLEIIGRQAGTAPHSGDRRRVCTGHPESRNYR